MKPPLPKKPPLPGLTPAPMKPAEQVKAWFWCKVANNLFVGISGASYPESKEVSKCEAITRETADDVFLKQIHPWRDYLITPGKGVTLFYKTVQQPPRATQ